MSRNQIPISSFEKSAYKFIDELKDLSVKINTMSTKENRKDNLLIFCAKEMMNSVKKELEEVEKKKILSK